MWYSTTDGQYIYAGNQFTIDGVEYPSNWLNLSTEEEKTAIGLEEVIATNSPANDQYYWVSTELKGPVLTYINTPKDLINIKANSIASVNNIAYTILFPTDWMSIKAIEISVPMPASWKSWRESIRLTAQKTVSSIEAAEDVPAVESIMGNIDWAKNPDQVAAQLAAEAEANVTTTTTKESK